MAVHRTVIDDAPPPPAPGYPQRSPAKRPRGKGPIVLAVVVVTVAVLAIAGFAFYWVVLHYEPIARRHVPVGTSVALRADFEEIASFGPVRRNLLPLARESAPVVPGAPPPTAPPRSISTRIEDATGLHLDRDLREAIFCAVGETSSGKWAFLVGGKIPDGMVKGLAKVAAQEGMPWDLAPSGDLLVARSGSAVLGQAADGTLVFASDQPTLAAAFPAQDTADRMGLPVTGALTFIIGGSAFHEWGSGMASAVLSGLATFNRIDGANGELKLGSQPKLEAKLRVAQGVNPQEIATSMLGAIADLRRLAESLGGTDAAGERQVLAGMTVTSTPDGIVHVQAPWPVDGLERGMQSLAQKIRALRSPPPPPAPTGLIPGMPAIPGMPVIQFAK